MAITLAQIINAISDYIAVADGVSYAMSQARSEIEESIPDPAIVQVYFVSLETSYNSGTDRKSFGADIRQTLITVYVDVYAQTRSHIGEDLSRLLDLVDAVQDRLELVTVKPYFALVGIGAFQWRADWATLKYGVPEVSYTGVRFTLSLTVF